VLFNSYLFVFLFVPIAVTGYFVLSRVAPKRVALAWLVGCSWWYYGWWSPAYLVLIGFSIVFNYACGCYLGWRSERSPSKWALAGGVAVNLALLGYFKYTNFFLDSINTVSDTGWRIEQIILPLGISFFTFQQVAFLVDAYRGEAKEYNFVDYSLFVSFFPQLVAGPIVHHKEMLPQFTERSSYRLNTRDVSIGGTIFLIGLFKKVVMADNLALWASPVFDAAEAGSQQVGLFTAWGGVAAYTFQLYFDFSGYSDMAIGLGRLFGIRLPLNFDSPYKATNAIDFWRRWHMTLSRFLRDYLYIPLGGNRKGKPRRYVNLMVTMLLGGLWHGAGWTFVLWGAVHGLYLCVNQAWLALRKAMGHDLERSTWLGRLAARAITLLAVSLAWVLFRAESLAAAGRIYEAMLGLNGSVLTIHRKFAVFEKQEVAMLGLIVPCVLAAVWLLPNTQQIMGRYDPALDVTRSRSAAGREACPTWLQWRPNRRWAATVGAVGVVAILFMSQVSEFIYYQF